jgi:hypothetical protein
MGSKNVLQGVLWKRLWPGWECRWAIFIRNVSTWCREWDGMRQRVSTWLAIVTGLLVLGLAVLFALAQSNWLPLA